MKRTRPDFDLSDKDSLEQSWAKVRRVNKALFNNWEVHDWFMWISAAIEFGEIFETSDMEVKLLMAQYAATFENGEFGIPTARYGEDILNDQNCENHVWKAWHLNTLNTTTNEFY